MNIEYSQELRDYFQRKGRSDLLLRTISPTGCCGGAPEVIIDLLKPEDVESSKGSGVKEFNGELGKVLMEFTLVPEDPDATVHFDVKKFIGLTDITATGLRQLV